jgi:hypothetical protein
LPGAPYGYDSLPTQASDFSVDVSLIIQNTGSYILGHVWTWKIAAEISEGWAQNEVETSVPDQYLLIVSKIDVIIA